MKKGSKFALAALALSLVPFALKPGKDGEFSYQSLLFGISSKKNEEGKRDLTISLFNLPRCVKKKPAEGTPAPRAEDVSAPAAESTEEAAPEEASASQNSQAEPCV